MWETVIFDIPYPRASRQSSDAGRRSRARVLFGGSKSAGGVLLGQLQTVPRRIPRLSGRLLELSEQASLYGFHFVAYLG